MIALLYFLLASGDTLLRQAVSIAPRLGDKRRVVEIARETEDDISYYLVTISLINAGLGVAVGAAMYLLGMPNAILWAVMAALFNYVPFLGAVAGIGIVALVALLTFDAAVADPAAAAELSRHHLHRGPVRHAGAARPPPDPEPGRGVPGADRLDLDVGHRGRAARGAAARDLQDLLRSPRAAAADRHHARPLKRRRESRRRPQEPGCAGRAAGQFSGDHHPRSRAMAANLALIDEAPSARDLPYNARIAAALRYVVEHGQDQPSLETMAEQAGLSPFHFQRIFKRWAGISPKRFLQYVTLANAKRRSPPTRACSTRRSMPGCPARRACTTCSSPAMR